MMEPVGKLLEAPKGGKAVTSSDPTKKLAVAALKKASGASKVTTVRKHPNGTYTGSCLAYVGGFYKDLGFYAVVLGEVK